MHFAIRCVSFPATEPEAFLGFAKRGGTKREGVLQDPEASAPGTWKPQSLPELGRVLNPGNGMAGSFLFITSLTVDYYQYFSYRM